MLSEFLEKFMLEKVKEYPAKDSRLAAAYRAYFDMAAAATEGAGGNTYIPGTGGIKKKPPTEKTPGQPGC